MEESDWNYQLEGGTTTAMIAGNAMLVPLQEDTILDETVVGKKDQRGALGELVQ